VESQHILQIIGSQMTVKLPALCTGRPLSSEDSWYSFFVIDLVDPRAILQLEVSGKKKKI
jgi:hypothetical protein